LLNLPKANLTQEENLQLFEMLKGKPAIVTVARAKDVPDGH